MSGVKHFVCQDKINALLTRGLGHHRAAEMAAAVACYQEILALDPQHAEALHLLGSAALQCGSLSEASSLFERALAVDSGRAHTWNNLGLAYLRANRLGEAAGAYRKCLDLQPGSRNAWLGLARTCRALGAGEEAAAAVGKLLALEPQNVDGLVLRAELQELAGQWQAAAETYRQLLPLAAETGKVQCNLGNALLAAGDIEAALKALESSVTEMPEGFEAWHNLGRAAAAAGHLVRARQAFQRALALAERGETLEAWLELELANGNWPQALPLARQLVKSRSQDGRAWSRLAGVELEQGHPQQALAAAESAIAWAPGLAEAWYNRGLARHQMDDFAGAAADYAHTLALQSDFARAAANRVRALSDGGRWEEAMAALQLALASPNWADELPGSAANLLLGCCDWAGLAELDSALRQRGGTLATWVPPFTALALADDPALHQQLARAYAAKLKVAGELPRQRQRDGDGRIRIGYLSADLHAHATAYLAADLFECHDRSRFAVFAYSTGPEDGSPMRDRLKAAFETFRDVRGWAPEDIAQAIREDGIDLLVDLKGYTFRGTPQVLALRPAPVQASFLGYPGTLGAPWMDYIIADPVVIPPDLEQYYDEKVIRLPHCYQPNDRRRPRGRSGERTDHGLPAAGTVFCCFNQAYKITAPVADLWLDILREVPGSVLWLLDQNSLARRHLQARAEAAGVDPGRLVFAPPRPHGEHLGRMAHADLFLDTLPYNAHTTASDALWIGVPVLTMAGCSFAARVAASLVHAVGLPDLVCRDQATYRQLAIDLGHDLRRLAGLKRHLLDEAITHPLFDTPNYCRGLEAAYEEMLRV